MSMRRGLALSLVLALSWPTLAQAEPSAAEQADAQLSLGLAAYADGAYEQAIAHFKRSYALRADANTLYAWAQATRSAGDCKAAIELYQRFIDTGAAGESREAAIANQQRCREQLATAPSEPEPATVPPPEVSPSPPIDEVPPPVRAPRDPIGPALLGSGAALVVVGIALVIVGEQLRRRQRATRDYDRFDRLDGPIDGFYVGGGVTLGIGAVLTTIGGIRIGRRRTSRR